MRLPFNLLSFEPVVPRVAPKVKLLGTCPFRGLVIRQSRKYFDYFNPAFLVAKNRDFGRFVTTWYNIHCMHTQFLDFLDF